MRRKILDYFLSWKKSTNRLPLIVQGARQVGKTFSILEFGHLHYQNVCYFNFEDVTILRQVFDPDYNIPRIIDSLGAINGQVIEKEKTLIIFDEIQACPRALTSLKYFCEKAPDYHIIAAGSLLGVFLHRGEYSFPVGKVMIKTMYPMDFEEFLMALGKDGLINQIKTHFVSLKQFPLHEEAVRLYKDYLVVGGLPRAVKQYEESRNMLLVQLTQRDLVDSYLADMAKYAQPKEIILLRAVWDKIPTILARENKKFRYSDIKKGGTSDEFALILNWLGSAGMINVIHKTKEGLLPLSAYAETDFFKTYIFDTGLLCLRFGIAPSLILNSPTEFSIFKGALTENYVCQELITKGFKPYYWASDNSAEIDFVIQDQEGMIIPIECKSGENTKSKSLATYTKKYNPRLRYRVSLKNFGADDNTLYIPLYALFCLNKA